MNKRKTKYTIFHSLPSFNMKVPLLICSILLVAFQLFGQKLIPYLSHGKYGYADPQGQVRLEPLYDEVEFFDRFDVAAVRLDTQWFLINTKGTRLVKLESKKYSIYQALSSHGPVQYGSRKNIDTIPHLLRLELNGDDNRQYIHTLSGTVSPVFSIFNQLRAVIGMRTGHEGLLTHGVYIGQTSRTEHKVMNTQADIIVTSSYRPILLNDSLISYMKDTFSVILNFKTNESFTLPFFNTTACIAGTNFIVDYLHQSWDGLLRQNICLYKGLVDQKGTILIKPQYDDLAPFGENLLQAKKEDYWHLITNEGNKIDSNIYKHIFETGGHYYQAQLPNQKWVFMDSTGKQVLNQEFDEIEFNSNCECYFVNADSIASILTDHLDFEISCKADKVHRVEKNRYYYFNVGRNYGLLDQDGKVLIPAIYQWCNLYVNPDLVIIQQNGLKGIINLSGDVLMEPQYEDIGIEMFRNQTYIWVKKNGLSAYFDTQLNQITDFQSKLRYPYDTPIQWDRDENDSLHLFTRFGQPLGLTVESKDDGYVKADSTYLMLVHKNDTSFLLYEKDEHIIIDTFRPSDVHCYNLETGLLGVKYNDDEGVRHYTGKWIVPLEKQKVIYISSRLIICHKDDQYFFYDTNGIKVNTIHASWFEPDRYESAWRFEHLGKTGFISPCTGQVIIPPIYDDGVFYPNRCIKVHMQTKKGHLKTMILDTLGNMILETKYEDLYPIDWGDKVYYYTAEKNGKAGLIDIHGRVCIPLHYKWVSAFADTTFFRAGKEDQSRYIYNTDWQIAFADSTIPVGNQSIELPNKQIVFLNEFDELPGHRYLFYYTDYCLIVDHLGRTLKRVDTNNVQIQYRRYPDECFIEATENGRVYLIDPVSLVSFREETNK